MDQHSGHRSRMRARFVKSGSDSFADHELLELLLFYALPRQNTNDIAHSLLERFGSISGVASASVDELMLVDGIGEGAAVLIKLVMSLAKRYAFEELSSRKRFDTVEKVADYAKTLFIGSTEELLYIMLLDNSFSLIDCSCVAYGSINEVRPILRTIIERSIIKRASSIVLLHNHPNGIANPSENDFEFSHLVERELNLVGVNLVEHLIVSGKSCFPILKDLRKNNFDSGKNKFYES